MFKFAALPLLFAVYANGLPTSSLPGKLSVEIDVAGDWKIIGGSTAANGAYPFMASLSSNNNFFCGSTVLTNNYILTAAHCLTGKSATTVAARAGTNSKNSGGTSIGASKLIIHSGYNSDNLLNDIGLVKLNGYFTLSSTITQVGLVLGNVGAVPATAIGWGLTSNGAGATNLQELSLNTITNDECRQHLDSITDSRICTAKANGAGVCSGDSGGPLLSRGAAAQIGLTSYSINGCAERYAVFTRVSPYYDWIINSINSNYELKVTHLD